MIGAGIPSIASLATLASYEHHAHHGGEDEHEEEQEEHHGVQDGAELPLYEIDEIETGLLVHLGLDRPRPRTGRVAAADGNRENPGIKRSELGPTLERGVLGAGKVACEAGGSSSWGGGKDVRERREIGSARVGLTSGSASGPLGSTCRSSASCSPRRGPWRPRTLPPTPGARVQILLRQSSKTRRKKMKMMETGDDGWM